MYLTLDKADSVFDSVLLSINRVQGPQKSVFKLPYPLSHASILQEFRKHLQSVKGDGKVIAIFETMMPLPGIILPWKGMVQVCKEEGAWSVVDGAHSIGHELELDLPSADPDFWMTVSLILPNMLTFITHERRGRTAANGFSQRKVVRYFMSLYGGFDVEILFQVAGLTYDPRNQGMITSTVTPPLTYPTPGRKPSSFVSKFYCRFYTHM